MYGHHWTKSKYRKTHFVVILIAILGLFVIAFFLNFLLRLLGESFIGIFLSFFMVFYWLTFLHSLSIYLTGEAQPIGSYARYYLDIDRKGKGRGTIMQLAIRTFKICFIWSFIFAAVAKFILLNR